MVRVILRDYQIEITTKNFFQKFKNQNDVNKSENPCLSLYIVENLQNLLHIYHNFYQKSSLPYTYIDLVLLDKGSVKYEDHMYISFLL